MDDAMKALGRFRPYGWRAAVGVILPSANTVMEPELARLAPEGVTFHAARTPVRGLPSQASLDEMAQGTEAAALDLVSAEVDLILYGCTSGSFMTDAAHLTARLTGLTGIPATTTAAAAIAALRELGVRRVALSTPYRQFITDGEAAWLEAEGFAVSSALGLDMGATERERRGINRIPPEACYRLGRAADRPDADALFLSCTAMASLPVVAALERDLGKPVVTSNLASAWHALQLLGLGHSLAWPCRLSATAPEAAGTTATADATGSPN
jgi:maleate cis-trans isomerase